MILVPKGEDDNEIVQLHLRSRLEAFPIERADTGTLELRPQTR